MAEKEKIPKYFAVAFFLCFLFVKHFYFSILFSLQIESYVLYLTELKIKEKEV